MIIKFANEKEFIYSEAYCMEHDFCNQDGITRPSIEIYMPLFQTSYNEIESIISDANLLKSFVLIGNMPEPVPVYKTEEVEMMIANEEGNSVTATEILTVFDAAGNPIIDHYEQPEPVMQVHKNYRPEGRRVIIENDFIKFKLYQKNADEIENDALKEAVDTLLIAMEEV